MSPTDTGEAAHLDEKAFEIARVASALSGMNTVQLLSELPSLFPAKTLIQEPKGAKVLPKGIWLTRW